MTGKTHIRSKCSGLGTWKKQGRFSFNHRGIAMAALASALFFIAVLMISIISLGGLIGREWRRIIAALRGEMAVAPSAPDGRERPLWDWSHSAGQLTARMCIA